MPAYDYKCRVCGVRAEVVHGMTESPVVECVCGGAMAKVPSVPNIGRGSTAVGRRVADARRAEGDMKAELREDFGVHNVHARRGMTLGKVYNDVKGAGSLVKERMAQESERNAAKVAAKRKERHRTAPQRIPKRVAEVAERSRRRKAGE